LNTPVYKVTANFFREEGKFAGEIIYKASMICEGNIWRNVVTIVISLAPSTWNHNLLQDITNGGKHYSCGPGQRKGVMYQVRS